MQTFIFTRGKDARQQREICEEYAKSNGLEIIGTADDERTLNTYVLGGVVECVIVSHAARISRSRIEYRETEKMFNRFGVKLIAVEGETQ